jgi:molybdopterin molybdotransferase
VSRGERQPTGRPAGDAGRGASRGADDGPDWLPYPEALARVLERTPPLGTETVPLERTLGRALAADVRSEVDQPPWDNSAMDGFAVRAADVAGASEASPVTLPIRGDVPAGSFPEGPLEPGSAVRVMTGAPVPEGATGVIRVEHTDGGRDGRVAIRSAEDAEHNIRLAGEDLQRGQTVLERGQEVSPAVAGVLAAVGRTEVEVGRVPRVGILATGDELAGPDAFDEVRAGRKIANSNGPALAAQVASAGAVPVPLGIVRDRPDAVRARLEAAADCDVLLTTAGVSVGEHDLVRQVLGELGMTRVFWRVRIRPGSPFAFGLLPGARPVFGLPGNPVSALVTFEVLVRPALRRMAGHARLERRRRRAVLAGEARGSAELTYFFRVRLEEREGEPPLARLTGPQGSGILTSVARADALLVMPEGTGSLDAGAGVDVIPLDPWAPRPGSGAR